MSKKKPQKTTKNQKAFQEDAYHPLVDCKGGVSAGVSVSGVCVQTGSVCPGGVTRGVCVSRGEGVTRGCTPPPPCEQNDREV